MSIIAQPARITRPTRPAVRPATPPAADSLPVLTVARPASRTRTVAGYGALALTAESLTFTVTYFAAGPFVAVLLTTAGAGLAGVVAAVTVFASWSSERHAQATAQGIADAYTGGPR